LQEQQLLLLPVELKIFTYEKTTNSYSRRALVQAGGMAGATALLASNLAFEEAKKEDS
jgi:hypothetical protein